jgi:lipopolysaccharide/colanic/teichoic acid biosynthesis glycosyltransferase
MDEQGRSEDKARAVPRNNQTASDGPTGRTRLRLFLKRVFDVGASGLVLVLTLPILLAAAMAIKLESRGPVICRHVRVGKNGVHFEMFRLRSTVFDAEALRAEPERPGERLVSLPDVARELRVTRVGRFLRRTSIDELPQLWNVLRGEMSLVGPGPTHPSETESTSPDVVPERPRGLPGITGIWQVSEKPKAG